MKLKYFFPTIILLTFPFFVDAQNLGLQNPIGVKSISDLILIVTRVIRYIALPFVVIMIMYTGFKYIWLAYNSKDGGAMTDAHNSLKWVLIGAFILMSSELIALIMRNTIDTLTK